MDFLLKHLDIDDYEKQYLRSKFYEYEKELIKKVKKELELDKELEKAREGKGGK